MLRSLFRRKGKWMSIGKSARIGAIALEESGCVIVKFGTPEGSLPELRFSWDTRMESFSVGDSVFEHTCAESALIIRGQSQTWHFRFDGVLWEGYSVPLK